MRRILAIDPGTEKSGFIVWDGTLIEAGTPTNEEMLARIIQNDFGKVELCAIEMIEARGMPLGNETIETIFWIGRFYERAHKRFETVRVLRRNIKLHLCGTNTAKDANIRAALIDKHGSPGTSKNRGNTYGISGHIWAALAVADYAASNPEAFPIVQ